MLIRTTTQRSPTKPHKHVIGLKTRSPAETPGFLFAHGFAGFVIADYGAEAINRAATMPSRHVHITGASGAGVSTAGRSLADRSGLAFLDTDDFYWLPTDPPYRDKRLIQDRLTLLADRLDASNSWVLSGSLDGWGDDLIPRFDLVVFLYVPSTVRLQRLRLRERIRFGAALDPGGAMHAQHQAFLEWSASYDSGDHNGGRTLQRHRDWLAKLPCQVLRIEGDLESNEIVEQIVANIAKTA